MNFYEKNEKSNIEQLQKNKQNFFDSIPKQDMHPNHEANYYNENNNQLWRSENKYPIEPISSNENETNIQQNMELNKREGMQDVKDYQNIQN